ncbi:MAG: fructose-6-phosphate aldolase [Rhodobacteraceae bacterium]|nr:fructose-6-phosphate aldolase [Paracoccaceae bacterium]
MQFFVDTAETDAIAELSEMGILDGVTTNPSLVMKSGKNPRTVIAEICRIAAGKPVSAEVIATEADAMVAEGESLAEIADNIVVKVPLTWDGLKACDRLGRMGIRVNVTLCFNANQALLAAKVGAAYISPFVGRLDDLGLDGMELIHEIREIYDNFDFPTEILAASIRTPLHVTQAALAGADVATVPPAVLHRLAQHPLTDKGLAAFLADAAKIKSD